MKCLYGSIFALCSLSVWAQARPEPASEKVKVLEAERAGCLAYQDNDANGIRNFLADDYTLTDTRGMISTKQDDIEDALRNRIHYTTFVNKNMVVRLYPGTAIVTGQTVLRGTTKGKPFDIEVQFTDTLVQLDGRWKLVAGHVSRLRNGLSPLAAPIAPQ